MDETIQVSCIVDNIPPSWKDFKHTLKHKKEKLTLAELGSYLRIEESLRVQDSDKLKSNNVDGPSVVNMDDDVAWWVDSKPTMHVCKDRCLFKTYESLNDESILHMRIESTSLVHGRGCVDLRFSSGKIVSLFNVLHIPNIRKNLVSSSILNNCGYKQVIEYDKFVLSKHGVFIGVGYLCNQMFRLYIVNDIAINDEMDSIMGNNTWVLADLPHGCKPLGCKWIFKKKMKVDGTVEKFKARLVIHGFKQKSMIDYFDTYAPINNFLSSMFSMKDMEEVDVILGIKIKHESNEISIFQSHYIKNVLKKFNYFDYTLVSISMDTSEKLRPNNGQAKSQVEYSRAIGCLMYAMTCTRLDITFVVGKLSSWTYTGYPSVIEGYTDAGWINNIEDNSSTSCWVFLLGGEFVRSQQNLADHLTKGLARDLVLKSVKGMR
ncbi:zinc finger, CCHC-type containing protein [Tanacetum coccineum]|uniref:Zinc finger, CCHC-type containing protein n=1 Tax=Tanacetum coccineum TaxID=301880 RepID=A0ABQ5BG05_9ASTR